MFRFQDKPTGAVRGADEDSGVCGMERGVFVFASRTRGLTSVGSSVRARNPDIGRMGGRVPSSSSLCRELVREMVGDSRCLFGLNLGEAGENADASSSAVSSFWPSREWSPHLDDGLDDGVVCSPTGGTGEQIECLRTRLRSALGGGARKGSEWTLSWPSGGGERAACFSSSNDSARTGRWIAASAAHDVRRPGWYRPSGPASFFGCSTVCLGPAIASRDTRIVLVRDGLEELGRLTI
mmetsp:Transcript_64995/g.153968  ORF Transcript_64995/g.153968 Transcript_64995/m.153968 type:complete len:238 (+) Transcript_64995:179-892(+)